MSKAMRHLIVAAMLGIATMSFVSTVAAPILHAQPADCKQDDEREECKNK